MQDQRETVTVLMSVYNGCPYLEAAVESIRQQTYRDFEFLIVNNGSTDGSAEVLQRHAAEDRRIRVVPVAHQMLPAALNHGLSLANGTVIVRIDSDDTALPERIERQLAFLAEHPEVVVVGSAMQLIDKDGHPFDDLVRYPLTCGDVRNQLLAGICALGHPAVAMRRDVVLAEGGYRGPFDCATDYDLWLRLSERHALANLPDVLTHYRWHGANTSIFHYRDQVLAAHVARLAAHERDRGQPDPTVGLATLRVRDLDRFHLPPDERSAIMLDLSEAGLSAHEATGEARHLVDVEETLFWQPARSVEKSGAREKELTARLVRHLWKGRQRGRAIVAAGKGLRADISRVASRATARIPFGSSEGRHAVRDWLIHCADPLGPRTPQPRRPLSPSKARELVEQADMHGVLPAVLRDLPALQGDPAFADLKADGLARHRAKLVYSLMLRTHGDAIMAAAADLPVVIVKGPVFASAIYPSPGLRTFTDIDLLIARDAEVPLARLLEQEGFKPAEYDCDPARQERKWLHRDNDALMIEVHTNLVHHPELRSAMSVAYADLAGIDRTPAALLTVAAVHGALSRYEILRHVVDICQAARGVNSVEEECRFEALVQRTGARFAAVAGLDLAYRLLGERRCRDLAHGLGRARYAAAARLLLGRTAITSTMGDTRYRHSWRRQLFRELMKRSRNP